jgi:hypothetical protein
MKRNRKNAYLNVKIAGGATAQCLGLMNAIYASKKLGVPFKISYYPYSTGTYWPFAIKFLVKEFEILDLNLETKGLTNTNELETGKIIKEHPLFRRGFSYERFLSLIRHMKLESKLQFLRRELAVKNSSSRLVNINRYYNKISGGFAQINDIEVNKEMNTRFEFSEIKSPFAKIVSDDDITVIHYRLGDKKATPGQMKHTKDFNTDLIIDPKAYFEIINQIKDIDRKNIFVVSDEPQLAQKLLAGAGVKAKIYSRKGNIWDDVLFMSKAKIFIGTKSQVSQLANICVENNGGRSYMLNFLADSKSKQFKNTTYLTAAVLNSDNEIYALDFKLEESAHTAYKTNYGTLG